MLFDFIDYKYRLRIMFITFFMGINSKLNNWHKKGKWPIKRLGWPTRYAGHWDSYTHQQLGATAFCPRCPILFYKVNSIEIINN